MKRIVYPYLVVAEGPHDYAIVDLRYSHYVARKISSRSAARSAATALNECVCEWNEDGQVIAVGGKPLASVTMSRRQ